MWTVVAIALGIIVLPVFLVYLFFGIAFIGDMIRNIKINRNG